MPVITRIDVQMSIWLEIGPCRDSVSPLQLQASIVQKVSVLTRLMSAAQQAKSGKQSLLWDYSLKVSEDEAQQVKDAIDFGGLTEDSRSAVLSAAVDYGGECYAIRLFFEKSQ